MRFLILLLLVSCNKHQIDKENIPVYSYNTEIKPIFEKNCSQCHNPNWPAKNWLDYSTAFNNRLNIKVRVWDLRSMPPNGQITQEDRKKIKDWVESGAHQ